MQPKLQKKNKNKKTKLKLKLCSWYFGICTQTERDRERLQTQRKIVCTLHFLYANFLAFISFFSFFSSRYCKDMRFLPIKSQLSARRKIASYRFLFYSCFVVVVSAVVVVVVVVSECGKWARYKVNKYKRHACVTGVWVSFSIHSDQLDESQSFVDHMMMIMMISRWEWYRFRMHAYRTSNVESKSNCDTWHALGFGFGNSL